MTCSSTSGPSRCEHLLGVLAAQGADLDDAPRAGCLDHRGNDVVPELVHGMQRSGRASPAPARTQLPGDHWFSASPAGPMSAGEAGRPSEVSVAAGVADAP